MKSRGYLEKGLKSLIPIAFASGAMLIRGYERGERVYLSMISRGFQGTIEFKSRSYKISYKSYIYIIFLESFEIMFNKIIYILLAKNSPYF